MASKGSKDMMHAYSGEVCIAISICHRWWWSRVVCPYSPLNLARPGLLSSAALATPCPRPVSLRAKSRETDQTLRRFARASFGQHFDGDSPSYACTMRLLLLILLWREMGSSRDAWRASKDLEQGSMLDLHAQASSVRCILCAGMVCSAPVRCVALTAR
jgi:hypothetical protein